jgi:hypothetical protein
MGAVWTLEGDRTSVYVSNNELLLLVKPTMGRAVDHGGPRIVLLLELKPTLLWDPQ